MNKSRKISALAVIVFFLINIPLITWGQEEDDDFQNKVFFAGLEAGANFAQVDGDYYAGYHKAGLNFGGIGYMQFKPNWALSMELLFSQKGSKSDVNNPFGRDSVRLTSYNINLNYAEIPVMINYFDKRKSHVGLGVSYSQLLNSSESMTTSPAYNIDLSQYKFKKSDFQVVLSGSLHMWKGLFLNIKFQYSLAPIRTDIPTGFARANQYNNLWTVRLVYLFY